MKLKEILMSSRDLIAGTTKNMDSAIKSRDDTIALVSLNNILLLLTVIIFMFCSASFAAETNPEVKVPILLYHRILPVVKDDMTVQTSVFAAQMQWLKDNNYTVIPLRTLVNYLRGAGPAPEIKSVVIVADDGDKSIYTQMLPIVRENNIPVTLFIYPSAISNPKVPMAMSWEQLKALHETGLFDIQSHTVWHPNFKKMKKQMAPEIYQKFIDYQFLESKKILDQKLEINVDMLAYPFGVYDKELGDHAAKDGYIAAFTIVRHHSSNARSIMAQPRYIILNTDGTKNFANIVNGHEDRQF